MPNAPAARRQRRDVLAEQRRLRPGRKPRIVSISVVLPAPLPPSRATISPAATTKFADLEHGAAHAAVPARPRKLARTRASARTSIGRPRAMTRAAIEADQAIADARQQLDVVIDDQTPRPASRRRRSSDQLLALAVGHAGGGLVEQQERRARSPARAPGRRRVSPSSRRLEGAADAGARDRMRRQTLDWRRVEASCRRRRGPGR